MNLYFEFNHTFELLFKKSKEENYFWQYCPFEVYQTHFEKRYQLYHKEFDCTLKQFANKEIETISAYEYENIDKIDYCFQYNIVLIHRLNPLNLNYMQQDYFRKINRELNTFRNGNLSI